MLFYIDYNCYCHFITFFHCLKRFPKWNNKSTRHLIALCYHILSYAFSLVTALIWKFLYQTPHNSYANMHRLWVWFPALWVAGHSSFPVSRPPTWAPDKICKQFYFHHFIHMCWSPNVHLIDVHNRRLLMVHIVWRMSRKNLNNQHEYLPTYGMGPLELDVTFLHFWGHWWYFACALMQFEYVLANRQS